MRAHIISAATALSLGYAAGFASDGIVAKAAVPVVQRYSTSLSVPNANATITEIWARVKNATCAAIEADNGLDPGDCDVVPGTVVSFTRGETSTQVSVTYPLPGTFTRGAPQ